MSMLHLPRQACGGYRGTPSPSSNILTATGFRLNQMGGKSFRSSLLPHRCGTDASSAIALFILQAQGFNRCVALVFAHTLVRSPGRLLGSRRALQCRLLSAQPGEQIAALAAERASPTQILERVTRGGRRPIYKKNHERPTAQAAGDQ